MSAVFDLAQRRRLPELMDDPALDPRCHTQALRGLQRINRISGSTSILWRPIRDLARRHVGPLRVLDLATGAGDLPVGLWQRAQRSGVPLEISAGDISAQALAHARAAAGRHRAEIHLFQLDALRDAIPPDYDVITSSLFLHHLDDADAVNLLQRMAAAARRMILVNDLRRCHRGLLLAYVMPRILCRSHIVHNDGVLSVRAAYTLNEVRDLSHRADLQRVQIVPRWPCRFLLQWTRP